MNYKEVLSTLLAESNKKNNKHPEQITTQCSSVHQFYLSKAAPDRIRDMSLKCT